MSIIRALVMLPPRVCHGSQLLLILLYYIPRYMFKALEKTRLVISICLISEVAWTFQENALMPNSQVFPTMNHSMMLELGPLAQKLSPSFFFGRISMQIPLSAAT